MTSPQGTTVECFKCKQPVTISRTSVRYWPLKLCAISRNQADSISRLRIDLARAEKRLPDAELKGAGKEAPEQPKT